MAFGLNSPASQIAYMAFDCIRGEEKGWGPWLNQIRVTLFGSETEREGEGLIGAGEEGSAATTTPAVTKPRPRPSLRRAPTSRRHVDEAAAAREEDADEAAGTRERRRGQVRRRRLFMSARLTLLEPDLAARPPLLEPPLLELEVDPWKVDGRGGDRICLPSRRCLSRHSARLRSAATSARTTTLPPVVLEEDEVTWRPPRPLPPELHVYRHRSSGMSVVREGAGWRGRVGVDLERPPPPPAGSGASHPPPLPLSDVVLSAVMARATGLLATPSQIHN
uniref:Uncharacterized protein n=1 Tax=Oryza meridionalis TaxID=40149 RepID=A0A0E0C7J1_9ORYZ